MFSCFRNIRRIIRIVILFLLSTLLASCTYPEPINKYKTKENFVGIWEGAGIFNLKSDGTFTYSLDGDYLAQIGVPKKGSGSWDFSKYKKSVNLEFTMPTKTGDSTIYSTNIFFDVLEYSETNSEPFAFAISVFDNVEKEYNFYHKK